MKRPGPLLTLLAGLLLGLFMLVLNTTTGTEAASSAPRKEPPAATASPAPARSTASPRPSPSRSAVTDGSYAGRTDDGSSAVAVSVRGGRAIAYFCDGRSRESWLKGDVKDDGGLRLTGTDGAELNGTVQENTRIRGSVGIAGGHYAFTADRARKPSGLYRATATVRGARIDGGWIVLQNGRQVGVVTRGSEASAAPAIDPRTGAVTVGGRHLTPRPVTP
ncbi:hypothetical protein [Streptomyces sediminimaris]|uniref:hypothetical protein n=1 Tax=Streptomyces sediminimaris TaxID=3383721 RepID=UPI00399BE027